MHKKQENDSWEYDGSFYGFLTVVYYAFSEKKFPEIILTSENALENLFPSRLIETNELLAVKICERLSKRLSTENYQFIIHGFYCSLKEKERCLLDAITLSLQTNDWLNNHLGHPSILALNRSIKSLLSEVHAFTGFIRFEYVGTVLYSKIATKHLSLPFICPHFAKRYPEEILVIYDETHKLLATIEHGNISLVERSEAPECTSSTTETEIQTNWLTFLNAVTIHERKNEKTQLSHLPKRFRNNMIDFNYPK